MLAFLFFNRKEVLIMSRLELLGRRKSRCVCKYCGGALTFKRIAFSDYGDARSELYCPVCARIEFGTEPEIYASAAAFVDRFGFNYFPELDESEQSRRMNIAKVCEIIAWGDRGAGLLSDEGYTVPVRQADLGEATVFSARDLAEEDAP